MHSWIDAVAITIFCLPCMSVSADIELQLDSVEPVQAFESRSVGQDSKQVAQEELKARLEAKAAEMEALKDKATSVTKSLAELAASGKVPTSQEAIQIMKAMVEQLELIQKSMETIQRDIESMRALWEASKSADAKRLSDLENLSKTKLSSYIQIQYRDTNQKGGANDAFSLRRVRLGLTQSIDKSTSIRATFDLATGTTTNVAQLRDAFVKWEGELTGKGQKTEIRAGQFPADVGYEIARSSSEREFPERSAYNRTLFSGERLRGVQLRQGVAQNWSIFAGAFNVLTYDDPEQRSIAPGPENRLGVLAGLRWKQGNHSVGISTFHGERPKTTTSFSSSGSTTTLTHPRVDREFYYLDAQTRGLIDPRLDLRAEAMTGRDRIPVSPGSNLGVTSVRGQVPMSGGHVQATFAATVRNHLHLRWEGFDPNRDIDGDSITAWGLGWSHFLNPNTRFTFSQEWVRDPSRIALNQTTYRISTLRATVRF